MAVSGPEVTKEISSYHYLIPCKPLEKSGYSLIKSGTNIESIRRRLLDGLANKIACRRLLHALCQH